MKATAHEITEAALALSPDEKEILAEKIICSLHQQIHPLAKQEQLTEVARRRHEILSGNVTGVPLDQVIKEIQTLIR